MENSNYVLSNGMMIDSPVISEKMFKLAEIKPDTDYDYTLDESGMAEVFAKLYENDTRFCPEARTWMTYDEGVWKRDVESLLVSEKIKEFRSILTLYCMEIESEERKKEYYKLLAKMGDRRFRERMLKDCRDSMSVSIELFDNHPYLINCINGTYNLENQTFREHRWQDFITMRTNFEFTSRHASEIKCERWEQFIEEVTEGDHAKASFLQRALGYSMIGSAKEECMFILHGKTTRNGKSTLLGALEYMLGDYSSVSPVSIICKSGLSRNADSASPTIAALKGKRFVTMAESNQYGKLDEEQIKQLTGGEKIQARNLYEKGFTYLPQFTLWLSCNDLPAVQDRSLFASDRIKVVEFNRHFKAEERDTTLKDTFRTKEAMQGIFAWLVTGYVMYLQHGLSMSEGMQKVIRQYENDNDVILQFLQEKCEKVDDESIKVNNKTLYDQYKIWARSNGYFVMTSRKFISQVKTHPQFYICEGVTHGYPCLKGIKLKEV